MHFRDSLNGLGIPGNIWFHRFTVTYIPTKSSRITHTSKIHEQMLSRILFNQALFIPIGDKNIGRMLH